MKKKKSVSIRVDFGEDIKGRPISYYYTLKDSKPPIGSLDEATHEKISGYKNENRKVAKYDPEMAKKYYFYRVYLNSILGFQCVTFYAVPKKNPG